MSSITADTLLEKPTAFFDNLLKTLKSHEFSSAEMNFKSALIQCFQNKGSDEAIVSLLSATPRIILEVEQAEQTFKDRFKYLFFDFYYLSSDLDYLKQLGTQHTQSNHTLNILLEGEGFLNPNNVTNIWWATPMQDYYAYHLALNCIKQACLRYSLTGKRGVSDDIHSVAEILNQAIKEFGSKMSKDNTFYQPLKDACSKIAASLSASCLNDEIKLEITSTIVGKQVH